ncbi:thiamine pyrophosphate-dependent enzyme [Natronorarus salvus]|uniref:thiamine pyrophosphate-dependent enzyme n=1 Tax=Natronorarus salvus TaxID=3117733 RepID=UPI002F265A0E
MSSDPSRADQATCTEAVLDVTPDAAVVSNLGVASYVLAGVRDRKRNFYCWGSMGLTTPVGLGLALATDDPITVLDGDGSTLMSLGALATVADCDPSNLTVVVFDNAVYATTGGQRSHSETTDFAAVAEGVGLSATHVSNDDAFREAYREAVEEEAATLIACDVAPADPDARPPLDATYVKRRFRSAVVDPNR